jgi:outer membrane protein assembly factor BamA
VIQPRCFFLWIMLLLLVHTGKAQDTFLLRYRFVDTLVKPEQLGLQTSFNGPGACTEYIFRLPKLLQQKGFVAASVDSVHLDSAGALVQVYVGKPLRWVRLQTNGISPELLSSAGYRERNFNNQPLDYASLQRLQQRLLDQLENSGYPFAEVYIDSLQLNGTGVEARLSINRGPLYRIDSIRVYGNVNISNRFLQRYLEIPNGSIYEKRKLQSISNKLLQLPYLVEEQPWNMNLLGTGSLLNLYLKNKKNSQVNGILGFLPATDQLGGNKLLVTGDFNLNLKNGFGLGESLVILFQQIQVKSPVFSFRINSPFYSGQVLVPIFLSMALRKIPPF